MTPRVLGALALALVCLVAASVRAAVHDPDREWQTAATSHFVFHYPEKLAPQASLLAAAAEKIHPVMTKLSGWEPAIPTEVVLLDDTDSANGSATILGRPTIVLHAAEATFGESIADTGNWLAVVFIHEYAHILNLDYRADYSKFFSAIFGRVEVPFTPVSAFAWLLAVPPEGLMPPWAVEGSAVNFESDLTGRGRLNSTWYAMLYRADVAENSIPTLDRLGGDYPGGHSYNARYLYGARLMREFTETKGLEGLGDLFRAQAARLPFAIEKPALEATGADYPALHARMSGELTAQYSPVIDKIRRAGETLPALLTTHGFATGGPRWLGADKLAFTLNDPYTPPILATLEISTGLTETLTERPGPNSRPSLGPAGRLLFTMEVAERPWAGNVVTNALHGIRPDGKSCPEKLTEGLRVRHAEANPSQSRAVVVLQEENGQKLALLDLAHPETPPRVLLAEPATRYDAPALSPDGRLVAVSRKASDGKERLALLDLTGGESPHLLTPEGYRAAQPTWSPDSRTLYFTSDADGVYNLHSLHIGTGEIVRLTNLVGGAFAPDASPDGRYLAYQSYSARGFDLALLELAKARRDPAGRAQKELLADATAPAPPADLKGLPYSALPYFKPVYWLPDFATDGEGPIYGAWTAAHDPLDQQSLVAALFWSAGHRYPYGLLAYSNDAWYPTFTLSAGRFPALHSELLGEYDYWELTRYLDLSVAQKLAYPLKRLKFSVGYRIEEVSSQTDAEDVGGSQILADAPFKGSKNGFYASFAGDWTPGRASLFSVAPEGGRTLGLTLTERSASLGSDLDSTELRGYFNEYLTLPMLPRWVLTLSGRGGWGRGDRTLQGLFQAGDAQGEFPLRGYRARAVRGDRLATATAQLNFPLLSPYRGWSDNPLFLMHLDGALFFDAGRTWDNPADAGGTRRSAGGEARLNFMLGYYLPVTATAGVARGFDEGGENLAYFYLTVGGQSLGGSNLAGSLHR